MDFLTLVQQRFDLDSETLSQCIQDNFGGSLLSLKQLEEPVREINRRFKHLSRKKHVDGTFPAISGCRTFKIWCQEKLHRSDRSVRYMLQGGNKKRTCKEEKVSVPWDAQKILNFTANRASELDHAQRRVLGAGLKQLIDRL